MGSMVCGLADAVLDVVRGVGLSSDTVARDGKCCDAVVEICARRGFYALSASVVDEFAAGATGALTAIGSVTVPGGAGGEGIAAA